MIDLKSAILWPMRQISKHNQSLGSVTTRNLLMRRLIAYWDDLRFWRVHISFYAGRALALRTMTPSNRSIALLAICAGNSSVTDEFSAQRPVTRSFDVFFDLLLNKRMSKQWWGLWFETPSHPLWRHCNDVLSTFCGVHYFEADCYAQPIAVLYLWNFPLLAWPRVWEKLLPL